jgi:hypothetical protein
VAVVSPGRGVQAMSAGPQRTARLRALFPFVVSQARLRRDFRVDSSSCGLRSAAVQPDPSDRNREADPVRTERAAASRADNPRPDTPSRPDTPPSTPDTPSRPDTLSRPETPSTPEPPSRPETPSTPADTPTRPDTPSRPETPDRPSTPDPSPEGRDKPGNGRGDQNHDHSGPPGREGKPGKDNGHPGHEGKRDKD